MDGNTKNIDGEVFNNPFQLTAPRNGGSYNRDDRRGRDDGHDGRDGFYDHCDPFQQAAWKTEGWQWRGMEEEKLENCFANITQKLLPTFNIPGSDGKDVYHICHFCQD